MFYVPLPLSPLFLRQTIPLVTWSMSLFFILPILFSYANLTLLIQLIYSSFFPNYGFIYKFILSVLKNIYFY